MNRDLLYGQPRWMFDCVFGTQYVKENRHKDLEEFMNESPQKMRVSKSEKIHVLICNGDKYNEENFGEKGWTFEDISNLDAFHYYGIDAMEEAREKTSCLISGKGLKIYNREKRLDKVIDKLENSENTKKDI